MSASALRAAVVAHDRVLADWLEAEALVAALRRSTAAAAARAAERARAATMLARAGRVDAFARGVADAAEVLAQRAATEERRLEAAIRCETLLRARVTAARRALAGLPTGGEPGPAARAPCE